VAVKKGKAKKKRNWKKKERFPQKGEYRKPSPVRRALLS
jgi:hypothetical protein